MKTKKIRKSLDICKQTIANLENQNEIKGGTFDTFDCYTNNCPTYSRFCIIPPPNAPC